MKTLVAIIKSFRPKQWTKNMFIFAALVFAGKFTDISALFLTIFGFILFSLAASSVYLINDVVDYEIDKKHPIKRFRPIASGKLKRSWALLIAVLLLFAVTGVSYKIQPLFSIVIVLYLVNNIFYSFIFKHVVIIDILLVAIGFVLRAVGGVVIIGVPFSPWFLVIIFLLTLFIAIMKRRQEFIEIEKNGGKKRKVLEQYSIEMLDQMANITVPTILVSYIFFTFNTFHTHYFMLTIPLVVYGIFRYLFLVYKKDMGENPTDTLLTDIPLALCVLLWGIISALLIYFYE